MNMGKSDFVDRGRVFLHGLVYTDTGNILPPLRWTRQALRFTNDLLGRPICSEEELHRRHSYVADAEAAVQEERDGQTPGAPAKRGEAAPVVLYVTDQDMRTRKKLEEILKGRDIPFLVNDVTDDEASRSWALTQAKKAEFPLLFVAGEPLGGLDEVMQLDVRGELYKKVFG
jgi:glutaredoxin-related protein